LIIHPGDARHHPVPVGDASGSWWRFVVWKETIIFKKMSSGKINLVKTRTDAYIKRNTSMENLESEPSLDDLS
jgi:hypothetical protein